VVTAFNIESYSWLQDDPAERSAEVLERISLQLASFSIPETSTTPTMPSAPASTFHPSSSVVAINVLWFLALTTALFASLFAILVQQWLRQYAYYPHLSSRALAHLRQRRFDALQGWGVPQIISSLSILLQAGLLLFIGGLVVLLWSLHRTVALSMSIAAGVFVVAFAMTTVLPIFFRDSPYKSPLAWGMYVAATRAAYIPMLLCFRARWWIIAKARPRTIFRADFLWTNFQAKLAQFRRTNWSDLEVQSEADASRMDLRAVGWTTRVLLSVDVDNVAACLLETASPVIALLQWISYVSGTPLDRVQVQLSQSAWHDWPETWPRNGTDGSVSAALLRHACTYLATSSDYTSITPLSALHLMRWLDGGIESEPSWAPILLAALERADAIEEDGTLEFLSAQVFTFFDTSQLTEHHQRGKCLELTKNCNV
jgi:hypothetical protein